MEIVEGISFRSCGIGVFITDESRVFPGFDVDTIELFPLKLDWFVSPEV